MGDLKKRVLSALAIGPLILALFIFLPPGPFLVFMGIVLALAVYELTSIARSGYLSVIILLAVTALVCLYGGRPSLYVLWLIFSPSLYLLFRLLIPSSRQQLTNVEVGTSIAVLVLSEVFLAVPLYCLYRLKELDTYLPLVLLLTIWASDTAAYFVGKSIGKHKLAPVFSPKKTFEGLLGAIAGAIAVTLIFRSRLGITIPSAIAGGLCIGVLGQLGDILESVAKRVWEVKDSSGLIPGHGGVLDRLDSLLLSATFMYYYVSGFRG